MTTSFAARLWHLTRYYQAAALNAGFGFGLYALLVRTGLNPYVAQILSHCTGVGFNYFTYSRHAFRGSQPVKLRFVAAYVMNYLVGLAALAAVSQLITSPYLAGLVALVIATVVNYFALRHMVFIDRTAQ